MLNFAIIDDDTETVNKLSHMLESIFMQHDFDADISLKTTKVQDFISFIKNNKFDVLLLDINLKSYLSGLEIAEKVRQTNKDCYFIFITAFPEYGFTAYQYKTFDFIFKPIELERLDRSIVRLFDDIKGSTKKFVRIDNKNTIIDEKEIKYIKRDGMKLVFHTNYRDYEVYSSFAKIENQLPENFIRCHKSFIVNIDNITRIEPTDNIVYFNSSACDIGPKYKNKFIEVINNYGNFK